MYTSCILLYLPENKSSEYVKAHGQLDLIVEPGEGQDSQEAVEDRLQSIISLLFSTRKEGGEASVEAPVPPTKEDMEVQMDGDRYVLLLEGDGRMVDCWRLF